MAHGHHAGPDPGWQVHLSPIIDCFDGMLSVGPLGPVLTPSWSTRCWTQPAARSPQDDSENNRSARGPLRPRRPLPLAGLAIKNERQKHLRSMSRKACSPDSVACEGSFGRLKNELLHPRDRQTATIEQFVEAVDSYIRWYDEKRIKMSPRSPTIPGEPWTCGLNQSKYLSASTAGQDSMEIDKLRLWPNSCGGGALPAWPDCHRSTYCTTDALAREWCPGTKGCRLAPRRL